MHALPPVSKIIVVGGESPWLPSVQFGAKPFLKLCISLDRSLKKLEARYPSVIPPMTLQVRNAKLQRRPK
jgi:hypothetical protein